MLFGPSKKEPDNNKLPKNEFKELARTTCDQKFYLQTLKLKLEEIELFLEFCDADPKSKNVAESNNVLSVMDFLLAKNPLHLVHCCFRLLFLIWIASQN